MINKIFKEYSEEIHNKDKNYKKILSKAKGDGSMKKILKVAVVFAVIIIVGTVSRDIDAKIKWDAKFKEYQNRPEGVYGTGNLQEEYGEVLDMDYVTQNGVGVKVDSLLITDDSLIANISFKFDENIVVNSESFTYGFAIYDDNKNVYEVHSRQYWGKAQKIDNMTKFILQEVKGKYNKKDIYAEILSDGCQMENISANESERVITTTIKLSAYDTFPRSEKIHIRLFDLGYSMFEVNKTEEGTKVEAVEDFNTTSNEWNFDIDVPQKFYERQTTNLKLAKSIPGFEAERISITETGLVIKFKSKKYLELIRKGMDMNADEFRSKIEEMLSITDGEGNVYLELSSGTRGEDEYKITLDACKKDLSKKLYLNFKVDGKQYKTELIEK